jgi:predicted 2-oxoglutarate/Fe(II)-dependent dioxygenase YbiX
MNEAWRDSRWWDVDPESFFQFCLTIWYHQHRRIAELEDNLPPDLYLRVRAEDVLEDPISALQSICSWLRLDSSPDELDRMCHPELSPFARLGPNNAKLGNDPQFLRDPTLRRPTRPATTELPGPYKVDPWTHLAVSGLAHKFGYDVAPDSSKLHADAVAVPTPIRVSGSGEPWADVLATYYLIEEQICAQAVCALERLPLDWLPGEVHLEDQESQIRPARTVSTIRGDGLPALQNVIAAIDHYMSRWMVDNEVSLERSPVGVLRYDVGGQYAAHRDSGPARPNRVLTVLLYLNADYQGGETVFPDIARTIPPETGKMILFDARRLHAGAPVSAGRKYALVAWFGRRPESPT